MTMPTDETGYYWLPALLQASDSTYPTGAFANSFGLEGMVANGVVHDATTLEAFLRQDLASGLIHLDLPLLRFSRSAAIGGDLLRLAELDLLCHSLRSTRELRTNSSRVGKRRLVLLPAELVQTFQEALPHVHLPIAAGIESFLLRVPEDAAMISFVYQAFNGATAAAMKLLRLGQTAIQKILFATGKEIPSILGASRNVEESDLGFANPFLDIVSARHERAPSRLFLS